MKKKVHMKMNGAYIIVVHVEIGVEFNRITVNHYSFDKNYILESVTIISSNPPSIQSYN
jgi:hypothetical protein